jgi:hypothetical protein
LNFASLCFASKQKITKSKRSEKFKGKKSENKAKTAKKKAKKGKNRLEFCLALFRFEAKITKVK